MERYREFLADDSLDILFVHIREAGEIKKFVDATGGEAKTLLVRGGERMKQGNYGNVSDDEVENYSYDYYFTNDKPLNETELLFKEFLASILEG
jgi:hypothetical protein